MSRYQVLTLTHSRDDTLERWTVWLSYVLLGIGEIIHSRIEREPELSTVYLQRSSMKLGSLFTGYGGLDIAAATHYGAHTVWTSDNNPGASKIIAHRYPNVPNLGDITQIDWSQAEPVDILTGGWPCQPWSHAGKRRGAKDDRALWPEVARAVRALRPRYVVLENVAAIVTAGELARASADLAALRYVGSWMCLRAADVGAPHGRNRCFILARRDDRIDYGQPAHTPTDPEIPERQGTQSEHLAETARSAAESRECASSVAWGPYEPAIQRWELILGRSAPAPTEASPRGTQRLSPAFVEWMQGLPEGWVTNVPGLSRNAQLTALGNGVVPQQALAAMHILGVL